MWVVLGPLTRPSMVNWPNTLIDIKELYLVARRDVDIKRKSEGEEISLPEE
jgi:hypothetical protein